MAGTQAGSTSRNLEDWMASLSPRLWDVSLRHLAIPGSHDTMTYCPQPKSQVSPARSRLLHLLGRVAPCVARPAALRWSVTQAQDVAEQLSAGARFLDLRLAHEPHGHVRSLRFLGLLYSTALAEDTLTEVAEWLERHPREVIILACRGFEDMTQSLHEYLVACITNIFGDTLCPRGEVPTLRQLWARGQQVLVTYDHEDTVQHHPELWPAVPTWACDTEDPRDLISYLDDRTRGGRPDGLFVAVTHVSPRLSHVLWRPSGSLREVTHYARPVVSDWLHGQHPGPSPNATNIIAGDFVGDDDNGFMRDIIALNSKLLD